MGGHEKMETSGCPLWVGSGKFSPNCLVLTIGDGYRPEAAIHELLVGRPLKYLLLCIVVSFRIFNERNHAIYKQRNE